MENREMVIEFGDLGIVLRDNEKTRGYSEVIRTMPYPEEAVFEIKPDERVGHEGRFAVTWRDKKQCKKGGDRTAIVACELLSFTCAESAHKFAVEMAHRCIAFETQRKYQPKAVTYAFG